MASHSSTFGSTICMPVDETQTITKLKSIMLALRKACKIESWISSQNNNRKIFSLSSDNFGTLGKKAISLRLLLVEIGIF